MRKTLLKCVLSLLLASLAILWGQDVNGTLSGKITNAAGAGVAHAAVTVTDTSTNVSQRVLSTPGPSTVNVVLRPGNINETVAIKGTAPVVQDQSGEVNLGLGTRPCANCR